MCGLQEPAGEVFINLARSRAIQDAKNQRNRLLNKSLLLKSAKSAQITVMECTFHARKSNVETNFL